jgi:outer membrane protein assembly factor BamA
MKNTFIIQALSIKKRMKTSLLIMLVSLIPLLPARLFAQNQSGQASAGKDSIIYVGNIKIVRKNVFNPEVKEENKKLYLWVNKLHFLTKESVVRQELLFKEGQVCDEELLQESERNLRSLYFLGKAKIQAIPREDGKADILVKTQDQWSTTVSFSAQMVGRYYSAEAYFEEHNLLGWGKNLILGYQKNSDREHQQLSFLDGNMVGTHLVFQTDLYKLSDGHSYNFLFSRPLYSLSLNSTFAVQYRNEKRQIDYYQGGEELFSYQRRSRFFYAEHDLVMGKEKKKIASLFYQSENNTHSLPSASDSANYSDLLPANRKLQHLGVSLKLWHPQYEKLSYLDNFGMIEDVDLGWQVQGSWGLNIDHPFEKNRTDIASLKFLFPLRLGTNQFLFFSHSIHGDWTDDRWDRIVSQTETRFYFPTPYWQTLVFRALNISSWRQEKGYQLILGGTNGLRGFEKYRFSGKNELVANFEDRIYTPWRILTVALGGILFGDAGYVWNDKLSGQKLHADLGAGMLLGLTKSYNCKIIYMNLAKSLDSNDWIVSFGSRMYFEIGDM